MLQHKRILLTFLQYLLLLSISLLVCETISQLVLSKEIPKRADIQKSYDYRLNTNADIFWNLNLKAHPYFGFVCDSTVNGRQCNNYGFHHPEDFPIKKAPNDYVIAILGGSFSQSLIKFMERQDVYKNLLQNTPELKNKNVRFVNLSMPGFKQPQSYFTAAYFYDFVDFAVLLDGANEIGENPFPVQPQDFPKLYLRFFEDPSKDFWLKKSINIMRSSFTEATLLAQHSSFLGKSYFYHLLWLATRREFDEKIKEYSNEMMVNRKKEPHNTKYGELNLDQRIQQAVKTWIKYSVLTNSLFKDNKIPFLHYIQPSQYNKGSKRFSQEEQENPVITKDNYLATKSYIGNPLLLKAIPDLKKIHVPVISLRDIYKNELATIYIDDFCHVNDLGNKYVADKIVLDISEKLRGMKI